MHSDTIHELIHTKKWAERLLSRVESIRNSRGASRAKELSMLESEILLHLNPQNNDTLIDAKVKETHIGFFNRLNSLHPQLTDNEQLLCVYIQMKLTKADIASLKGIDSKSVNMARHRLKKKLNISQEIDMNQYLQTL